MIRNYSAEKQRVIQQLMAADQQLKDITVSILSAATVAEKLEIFHQRDSVMEQQRSLQVQLITITNQEIAAVNSEQARG